jgi:tetratricopeptide (TPR) repeat protein
MPLGQALTNLGNAYRALRRFEGAVGCHQRALVICRETGDRHGEGQALTNLGNAYQELRLSDRAAVSWRDAAAAMRDAGEHKQAARLEQLAASARARRRRWRRSG